ncbi:MAG: DNA-directed RNA polymerase subunit beta [Acidimicrobiales bacterium]
MTPRISSPDRFSFSALGEAYPLPDLLEIQRDSFDYFMRDGLREAFASISPITDFTGRLSLELEYDPDDADLKSPPKFTVEECRQRATTFSQPVFVRARFLNAETGEIKEQTVFMGDFPIMTEQGTFIINGTERVVVSQLVRSPGVLFQPGKDDKVAFEGTIHPSRGEWLQVDLEEKRNKAANAGARIARKRRVSIFTLLRALDPAIDEAFFEKFVAHFEFLDDQYRADWKKAHVEIQRHMEKHGIEDSPEGYQRASQETAWLEIYRRARPGEVQTVEAARQYFEGAFFSEKRYDLSRVGRYKLDRKLGAELARNVELFGDVLEQPHPELYVLAKAEVLAAATYLLNLARDRTAKETDYHIDDQDHFANRRIRSVGELIQNALRTGLSRMERVVRERMNTQDVEAIAPQTLINIRPVMSAIKEFFATSQLSQFMDQNNPLSGLTHKRRLSALGPGGLSRERAGLEVRDVHSSHYGRMCPIETPEGPNVGLIGYLANYARINEYGFIETPYRVVEGGRVTGEVRYFTADEEERFVIAQANTEIGEDGSIKADRVLVRRGPIGTGVRVGSASRSSSTTSEIDFVAPDEVELMDVSTRQIISVATSLIPFVEHDDAQRALMGANMQKQAVPLVTPEAPFVGTGMELRAALDSGDVLVAEGDGVVRSVSGDRILVEYERSAVDRYGRPLGKKTYTLNKFRRSNQDTSINQKPLVFGGETVTTGDLLADGTSTSRGELALGKNLLVAYMPWEGYNYEDAIIISERLVRDDVLTSIHVKEYEIDARDTKLGPEEITRDIPNLPDDILADLDDRGIVRIGAEVEPGDILVGKVTPKGETEQSPEERLLRAIFGEKAREVRDTSLKVPHGESGKVIDVKVYSRDEDHEMQPGVNQLVKVYVAQKRKIAEGDKLAGRHGNKGVISRILPEEDMPYLADGTPVDIILSPLGVPSRMNVGQILESHLGYAARYGWSGVAVNPAVGTSGHDDQYEGTRPYRKTRPRTEPAVYVATPSFDGAHWDESDRTKDRPTIQALFASLNVDGAHGEHMLAGDNDGKVTLFNGRTGEAYDQPISVGYAYMLKLAHMVDDKIHARSTGPYSMITAQPLGGKAQFGGQRFGEMEVWALEAYGAAFALQELLTVKSDDMKGRERAYEAIVKGQNLPSPGIPESFKVLIKEMQSLCLNVEVRDRVGAHIDLADTEEDFFSVTRELGIDISRPERGSDEEDARRAAERKLS